MELNHQETIPRIDPDKMARFYILALVKSSKVELLPTTRGLGGTTFTPAEMRHNFAIWALEKDAPRAAHLHYCVRCKQAFSVDDLSSSVTLLDPHGDSLHGGEAAKRLGTFCCCRPCPAFSRSATHVDSHTDSEGARALNQIDLGAVEPGK